MGSGRLLRKRISARGAVTGFSRVRVEVRTTKGTLLDGASIEILEVPPLPAQEPDATRGVSGAAKTDTTGVWNSGKFRPGTFEVRVVLNEFGPPSPVVVEGPVRQTVTFVPVFDLPEGQDRQAVTILMDPRNPRLIVTAFDVTSPIAARRLAGVSVELIGVQQGVTDATGQFTTRPAPFGSHGVNVKMPGFLSEATGTSATFTTIEFRRLASAVTRPATGDLTMEVDFTLAPTVDLPGTHPRPFTLWAAGTATPDTVADDPRLPNPGAGDTPEGQDGWDMGLNYNSLRRLARLIGGDLELPERLGGGQIGNNQLRRLGIVAHGAPGVLDVDQRTRSNTFGAVDPDPLTSLTFDTFGSFRPDLELLGEGLARNAVVVFGACRLAERKLDPSGFDGEELLKAISRLWKTVTLVAIRTIATTTTTNRHSIPLSNPKRTFAGMRDTRHPRGNQTGAAREADTVSLWNDLNFLPWLSETSPHATLVRDGSVIRRGDGAA